MVWLLRGDSHCIDRMLFKTFTASLKTPTHTTHKQHTHTHIQTHPHRHTHTHPHAHTHPPTHTHTHCSRTLRRSLFSETWSLTPSHQCKPYPGDGMFSIVFLFLKQSVSAHTNSAHKAIVQISSPPSAYRMTSRSVKLKGSGAGWKAWILSCNQDVNSNRTIIISQC